MGFDDLLRAHRALESRDPGDKDGAVTQGVLIGVHLENEFRVQIDNTPVKELVADCLLASVRNVYVSLQDYT